MIRRYLLRAVLISALAGGVWLILSGWSTDSPRDRFIDASISLVALLLAIGVALPERAFWALRIVAGAVGIAFLAYFGWELWAFLQGQKQTVRLGEPSIVMAGLGLVVIGLPMLLFALGGIGSQFLRHLLGREQSRLDDESRDRHGPAA